MRKKALFLLVVTLYSFVIIPSLRAGDNQQDEDFLQLGIDNYKFLEYEKAIDYLEKALLKEPPNSYNRIIEIRQYLGASYIALGNNEKGKEQFFEALKIKSDLVLLPNLSSPKILEIFTSAKTEYKNWISARDREAPVVEYSPSILESKVPYDKSIEISLKVTDNNKIKTAILYYRSTGDTEYLSVPLKNIEGDIYSGTIPSVAVRGKSLDYYIEVSDEADNKSLSGSSDNPFVIHIMPNPNLKPWYKKWWLWTIIGGSIAASTGITLALTGGEEKTKTNYVLEPLSTK